MLSLGCGTATPSESSSAQSGFVFITDYHDIGMNYIMAMFFEPVAYIDTDEIKAVQKFLAETPYDTCVSNGHGEDVIGRQIALALRAQPRSVR